MKNLTQYIEERRKKFKYLSQYIEESRNKLFEQTGAFFAFGQKQFDEAKKEGVNYVSLGGGLICPKENVKTLVDGLENTLIEGVKNDVKDNGNKAIIQREYFNYETQLTGYKDDAINALYKHKELYPDLFTDEIISEVFSNCFKLACENDWF